MLKCLPFWIMFVMIQPNEVIGIRFWNLRSSPYKSLDKELDKLLQALNQQSQRGIYNKQVFQDAMMEQLEAVVKMMETVQLQAQEFQRKKATSVGNLMYSGPVEKFYPWGG